VYLSARVLASGGDIILVFKLCLSIVENPRLLTAETLGVMQDNAGKDATSAFKAVGHSGGAYKTAKSLCIGLVSK